MIKSSNGIRIERSGGVVADGPRNQEEHLVVSHAHADHAVKNDEVIACSELTGSILEERFGIEAERNVPESIELIDAGHILGSSAVLVEDEILYTGDISTSERLYLEGFKPVSAEKLVIESTYGIPNYTFPEQEKVVERIREWIRENDSRPLFLFGYSLGKAQKIQKIAQEATAREIIAHGAVRRMNEVVEANTGLEFRAKKYGENKDLLDKNAIFIGPSRASKSDYIEKLVEKHDGVKAGFSGWAVDESFRYRGGYDKTFPLSDHCDFKDLVEVVKKVDPEKVYTHHGFDEAFASFLKRELGFNARALKNNQSSLGDF
ncbi:MAG: hypothetical protein ABEJ56_00985 [Candidatus Nanohaloarchaea archaeon]